MMNIQNKKKATESFKRSSKDHKQKQAIKITLEFSTETLKVRGFGKMYFKFQKTTTSNNSTSKSTYQD